MRVYNLDVRAVQVDGNPQCAARLQFWFVCKPRECAGFDEPHGQVSEDRIAIAFLFDMHRRMKMEVQVINTHFGLLPGERVVQAESLLGGDWLANEQCRAPVILCGDFNASPSSPVCRLLRARLNDAQTEAEQHRPRKTFSGRVPVARIDHIFIDLGLEVTGIEVPRSELAQVASDHLPLIADVCIPRGAEPLNT